MNNIAKALIATSVGVMMNANALLPNPTTAVPSTNIYSNTVGAGTITSTSTPLTVLPTTPPPLLSQSTSQTVAQNDNGLTPAVYAFVVQNAGTDNEQLTPIQQGVAVRSGDVIEYQGYFTNYSNERIRKTSVTMSIPAGVELVGGVLPVGATASINGNTFSRMPLRGNIGGVVQEIPFKYYKSIRWTVEDIGLGGTAVVKYRASVK